MKNKLIGILTAAVCASALCSSAYAVTAEDFAASLIPDFEASSDSNRGITVDTNAILPVYIADLHDLVSTGKLAFTKTVDGEWQEYVGDAVDGNGNYAGNLYFSSNGETAAWNKYGLAGCSIDLLINQRKIETLLAASGFDASNAEYMLARVEGFGYAFYVNNGTDEALVYANLRGGPDGLLLCDENLVAVINDEFIERAAAKLDHKSTEFPNYNLSKLWSDGSNPLTGGAGGNLPVGGGGSVSPLPADGDKNPPEGGGGENSPTTDSDDNNPTAGGSFAVGKAVCAAVLAGLGTGAVVFRRKRGR